MIQPQDLLDHAKGLVPDSERRPKEIDLRRGVSAAYYSVFHHMTEKAAQHLIGSAPQVDQDALAGGPLVDLAASATMGNSWIGADRHDVAGA